MRKNSVYSRKQLIIIIIVTISVLYLYFEKKKSNNLNSIIKKIAIETEKNNPVVPEELTVNKYNIFLKPSEAIDLNSLEYTLIYSDDSVKQVKNVNFSVNKDYGNLIGSKFIAPPDPGTYEIQIIYDNEIYVLDNYINIIINDNIEIRNIEISTKEIHLTKNMILDLSKIEVSAVYNNFSRKNIAVDWKIIHGDNYLDKNSIFHALSIGVIDLKAEYRNNDSVFTDELRIFVNEKTEKIKYSEEIKTIKTEKKEDKESKIEKKEIKDVEKKDSVLFINCMNKVSSMTGTTVSLDGKFYNDIPLKIENLKSGEHCIRLEKNRIRLEKRFHLNESETRYILGDMHNRRIETFNSNEINNSILESKSFKTSSPGPIVFIRSIPEDRVSVFINNKQVGTGGNFTLSDFPEGNFIIRFEKTGKFSNSNTIIESPFIIYNNRYIAITAKFSNHAKVELDIDDLELIDIELEHNIITVPSASNFDLRNIRTTGVFRTVKINFHKIYRCNIGLNWIVFSGKGRIHHNHFKPFSEPGLTTLHSDYYYKNKRKIIKLNIRTK